MHTYPMHGGDYLRDTAYWSEHDKLVQVKEGLLYDLAYRRLLDFYYGEEKPIPNKSQWVATQIRMLAHVEIVGRVLKEKFTLIDGLWHQKRCDEEIERYQQRAATNRENGKKGGRKPAGVPTAKPLGSKPRTRTKNLIPLLPPEGAKVFEVFWNEHPRKVGKPKALQAFGAALVRGAKPEDILAGLKRHIPGWNAKKAEGEGDKIPHPSTWLNRDGWNDEVMPEGGKPGGDGQRTDWWESKTGLLDRGMQLNIPAPADEHPNTWLQFKANVWVAAGDGPWWDKSSAAYLIALRLRDEAGAVAAVVMQGLQGKSHV